MLERLESDYDCTNASGDLTQLLQELATLQGSSAAEAADTQERINRLENQIHFIKNKCGIRP